MNGVGIGTLIAVSGGGCRRGVRFRAWRGATSLTSGVAA